MKKHCLLFCSLLLGFLISCSSSTPIADGDESVDGDTEQESSSDGDEDVTVDGDEESIPDGDSTITGETWMDTATGLTWEAGTGIYLAWDDALTHCDSLELGGYTDWRLPDISELRTLLRGCADTVTGGTCRIGTGEGQCLDTGADCKTNACYGCDDGAGPDAEGCYWQIELSKGCTIYWSSSEATGGLGENAWVVNFNYAGVDTSRIAYANYALCVR